LKERNSAGYYRTIAVFADRWLASTRPGFAEVTAGFESFLKEQGLPVRSETEYLFELLVLGVMLREHGREAAGLPKPFIWLLQTLEAGQAYWPRAEGAIKTWRGLVANLGRALGKHRAPTGDLPQLLNWLRANGENGRADRLAQWQAYCESLETQPASHLIQKCLELAEEFATQSANALGKYTAGVPRFLAEQAPTYRWRYDAEFVARTPLEYHLGMLGTELLNRAYRERFMGTRQKIVIVPPCMRAQPEESCKAIATPYGALCQGCTPSCHVHQVTQLGKKYGFQVFMIPDELRVFGTGQSNGDQEQPGVVGVSCALTNWSGGWDTEALGIPAQGLLLDYVGCKYHWDKDGLPTDTNLRKLQAVLGIDPKGS
jgi:hypothetical protein